MLAHGWRIARDQHALWLIGVCGERSRASKTIKQLCGNHDAVASAYSLFDYTIADDLGGEAAYVRLRDRAYHHGIRLASDMVPKPHGHRFAVGDRASGVVHFALGAALPGLQLQRSGSVATMGGWRSRSRTTILSRAMRRWSSGGGTGRAARRGTSITARRRGRAFRGMTRRSLTI